MKRQFLLVVALALLLGLMPFAPAFATPASAQTASISPASGTIGTTVTVTATGLTAGLGVVYTITVGGITVNTGTVTTANTVVASFAIPSGISPGQNIVIITAGGTTAFTYFDVAKGTITLSVSEGTVGSRVTVNGRDFARSVGITILWDGDSVGTTTSNASGTFSRAITVPETAAGSHDITAQTSSLDTSDAVQFEVKPTLGAIVPTSGAANTLITIAGKGFRASDTAIKVFLGATQVGSVASSEIGTIAGKQVSIGEFPGGAWEVKATDADGNSATSETKFTVTAAATLNPLGGNVGSTVQVRGTGFLPNASITLTLDAQALTPTATIRAASTGSFTGNFAMPKTKAGAHNVAISDGASTITATWTMESTAPAAPQLRAPINNQSIGALSSQTPVFSWGEVTDPSGVDYDFQLAKDATFTIVLLSKDNLTQTSVALGPAEALSRGLYYWRVRAGDGAGNDGQYSTPWAVQIGWPIPTWALVLLGILALLIIVLFVVVISRSMVARV